MYVSAAASGQQKHTIGYLLETEHVLLSQIWYLNTDNLHSQESACEAHLSVEVFGKKSLNGLHETGTP